MRGCNEDACPDPGMSDLGLLAVNEDNQLVGPTGEESIPSWTTKALSKSSLGHLPILYIIERGR